MERDDEPSRPLSFVGRQDSVEDSKPILIEIERSGPHMGLSFAEIVGARAEESCVDSWLIRATTLSGFPSSLFERGLELLGEHLHVGIDEDILVRRGNHPHVDALRRELSPEYPGIPLDLGGRLKEGDEPRVYRGRVVSLGLACSSRGYRR